MNFVPEIEFQPKEVIRQYQEKKLREHLAYLQAYSPFYKKMFADHHINVSSITSMDDLRQIGRAHV